MDILSEPLKLHLEEIRAGRQHSLEPLLGLFSFRGAPLNLRLHFQLEPLFRLDAPRTQVWQCGRQVAKSWCIVEKGIILCGMLPNFNILYIQPRFDQIQRFNRMIMRPLLKNCMVKKDWIAGDEENSFLIKTFRNNSILGLEYAFMNVERARGWSGMNMLFVDEAQDINPDFLPVLQETMSASLDGSYTHYTGTPKTTDGTLAALFERSSQGYWCIPCSCGKHNLASPAADMFKMIGKLGCVCVKCDKILDTRLGYYVHGYPERRFTLPGRHVGQLTHPLHCAILEKWKELLDKYENGYSKTRFYNEVLGIPCDEAIKLLSLADIRAASNHVSPSLAAAKAQLGRYDLRVLGIDWSGGGLLGDSHTAVALVCGRPGAEALDTIYADRIPLGMRPEQETAMLQQLIRDFQPHFIAHDYTGAGALREILLEQSGVPLDKIVPFTYGCAPKKDMISLFAPTDGARMSYILDKPRSLAFTITAIRAGQLTLPDIRLDRVGAPVANDPLLDLLALQEDPRETRYGSILYLITRAAGKPDDCAHAINFAAMACWYNRGSFPKLDVAKYAISQKDLASVDPAAAGLKVRE